MSAAHVGGGDPHQPVEVVPMRRRHLRGVMRIETQVCPRPWSIGLFLAEIGNRPDRHYVVARSGGAVIGYAGLLAAAGEGHVTTLAVAPEWQRRKVGTRLLLALAGWAAEHGCTALTLEVRMGNAGAQALYRRFGFVPAGVRRNYYVETEEDALVMWAHDVAAPGYARRLEAIAAGLAARPALGGRS
ncbi:MAG: ribosomal protein S18-alanine N-acetyltransferase [Actinomycetota bacterium]|nr:ribosomal protein S18-alanine N-acetyltransferase [Actinomycetota bacterium]